MRFIICCVYNLPVSIAGKMPHTSLAVAVVMERTPRALLQDESRAQWLHPGFKLELFRDEAEGYYLNLSSHKPFVFVNWLEEEGAGVPKAVTVSYNEAARLMDAGARVDGVPMPPQWIPWLAEYVERNYKPEPKKRSRPPSFKGAKRDDP